jgi:transposase
MVAKRKTGNRRKSASLAKIVVGKPTGVIQPRVQQVGPEHFGIVAVDCAKARSKWMLCDFYGKILVPPTVVEHTRAGLQLAVVLLNEARQRYHLHDVIVGVEMTGAYHKPVERAFRKAELDTRLVHPFASSHYRLPEHGDIKTDDHDLAAIFRAVVNGFGLLERPWDEVHPTLQVLCRHRRDLVEKRARLQPQIRHHLDRCLPGYTQVFADDGLWSQAVALQVATCAAERGGGAEVILAAGLPGVTQWLRAAKCRCHSQTVERILAWAGNAAPADPMSPLIARVWQALLEDWRAKTLQMQQVEREITSWLVQSPYVLLLSHPGINVVTAAELAGEMGPIENYAHARAISGRAGLFPSRYQSDEVDKAGGLSRFRNVRLKAAWLRAADNMIKCNAYWRGKYGWWKSRDVDPRDIRCRIANRLTRTVFQMIAGRKLYVHPSRLDRGYVMEKLLEFGRERNTPPHLIVRDLEQAARQIPKQELTAEARALAPFCARRRQNRERDGQSIGTLLVAVLARYGITDLEWESEARSPGNSSDAPTR